MTFHIFVNFLIVLFSYGKVKNKHVFKKDQSLSGEGKRDKGAWGRIPKGGLFLQNSQY